ncbi:MAG: arginine--tRNA ligase, partial [Deltaproteobacteria bacterium]|nr:arginine--tRNA ligase [Deltaproteobacteria bacterium]
MRPEERLKKLVAKTIKDLQFPAAPFQISKPKQKEHGDFACNIAFLLAKGLGKSPRDVAAEFLRRWEPLPEWCEEITVAGAGFINFRLRPFVYFESLHEIEKQKTKFGKNDAGKGKKVLLEFVSANPTGPLNVVSARAGAIGDTLAHLLAMSGYKVKREFYVNDIGNQIELFARSIEARCQELLGKPLVIPEGGYQGEYLQELA